MSNTAQTSPDNDRAMLWNALTIMWTDAKKRGDAHQEKVAANAMDAFNRLNVAGEPIRVRINFADGDKMETIVEAEEGAFSFRVLPDCPAISSLSVSAPGSKVEFLA